MDILKRDVVKPGDLHSIFEISDKRPNFDNMNNALNDSFDLKSDDEFVFL
jgi:hypothetical protein